MFWHNGHTRIDNSYKDFEIETLRKNSPANVEHL